MRERETLSTGLGYSPVIQSYSNLGVVMGYFVDVIKVHNQ